MVSRLNGKTQKTGRRCHDRFSEDESRGLGELRDGSSSNGLQQSGCIEDGCSGQDSTGVSTLKRNPTAGKILQRLKLIEAKYSDYVDNHQQQLEAQLTESRSHKLELTQEIAELEREVYNLISESSENKQE